MSRKNGRMTFEVADLRPVAAVLAVGLALSVTAFFMVRGYFFGVDSQQFDRDTAYYSENFKGGVARHINSMAAIHAFVSASHEVNRWEFSSFAHQILPQNSGFRAVLWLPRITVAQRKNFEDGMQKDGLFGLSLREPTESGELVDAPTRPDYLPVAYVEPFESSFSLIGVDLEKSPIYAPLFAEAARTGKVAVSPPLDHALVDGARAPIALVVFPLVEPAKGGAAIKPASANPPVPSGYALGVLQLDRVIQSTIGARAPVEAAIAYGPAQTVYAAGARQALAGWYGKSEFRDIEPFTVAGKHYFLAMRSPPGSNVLTRFYVPAGAGLLVLALTALLAQSMVATVLRKRQVERAVIERTAELQEINTALNAEIEQRKEAEEQLRGARDRAESAGRAKSAFLSAMSHELRTPLNAIIGFSSMLLEQKDDFDARTTDYLGEINASGVRLLNLINDILEITQMDAEEPGAGEICYLPDIVGGVTEKLKVQAAKAGVTLQSALDESLPAIRGDGRRLQKALLNLASNAIKFTERGGWAQIAAYPIPEGVAIEVSDNGVGMPADAEAKISGLFSQFDNSLARRHDGVGLGLTLVRRVADHHDARLNIFSAPGQGTRIVMTIPEHRVASVREVA